MKLLVIGSGGREHALVWKIAQSPQVEKIYCAPGNGGTANLAENVAIADNDIDALLTFAQKNAIHLTVVGPEVPLVAGIVDRFEAEDLRIFGPSQRAAILEGSKVFTKDFLKQHDISTADYERFAKASDATDYLNTQTTWPIVVKADGLAAGKGVLIARDKTEAKAAVQEIMIEKAFGSAGDAIIIEEFLEGPELSMLCFADGKTVVPMVSAKDYKKIGEGDTGLNTGGMGAISPNPLYDAELERFCLETICIPALKGMAQEDRLFKGILYCGLILTENGPKVLEFNARFGDPETQVILPRLKTDLIDIFEAVIDERLDEITIEWHEDAAATVVMASEGYPEKYEKGFPISGLHEDTDAMVFHAGTKKVKDRIITNGGRVLNVTAMGKTVEEALEKSYKALTTIHFEGRTYRSDIGS